MLQHNTVKGMWTIAGSLMWIIKETKSFKADEDM